MQGRDKQRQHPFWFTKVLKDICGDDYVEALLRPRENIGHVEVYSCDGFVCSIWDVVQLSLVSVYTPEAASALAQYGSEVATVAADVEDLGATGDPREDNLVRAARLFTVAIW